MATQPDARSTAYGDVADDVSAPRSNISGVGALIFVWIAWAFAAGFWALTLTTAVGIVQSLRPADGPGPGEVDVGGMGWLLMNVIGGLVVLGLAIAYGAWRWGTRDKRKDSATEASTAALYDAIERSGGDDVVSRSPHEHAPEERDSYRPA